MQGGDLANALCGGYKARVSRMKGVTEEKLVEVQNFLAENREGNSRTETTPQTAPQHMVASDRHIPELLDSSTARTVTYDTMNPHLHSSLWSRCRDELYNTPHHPQAKMSPWTKGLPAHDAAQSRDCHLKHEQGIGNGRGAACPAPKSGTGQQKLAVKLTIYAQHPSIQGVDRRHCQRATPGSPLLAPRYIALHSQHQLAQGRILVSQYFSADTFSQKKFHNRCWFSFLFD